MSSWPSAGLGNTSLGPPSDASLTTTARYLRQKPSAKQKVVNAITKLENLTMHELASDPNTTLKGYFKSCSEHLRKAAVGAGENFPQHYTNAFNTLKQIQREFPDSSFPHGQRPFNLRPWCETMTDLSRDAFIHEKGTKDASNCPEDQLHEYWIKTHKINGKSAWFLS